MKDYQDTLAFAVHLRAEHRRLHELLRGIETGWPARGKRVLSESQTPPVIDGLEALREELARHFAQEEQGGCLEEAVCRCPSLTQEANQVEREHPLLLERLEGIIVRARSGLRTADVARETKQDFKKFARQLHAHEAAENRILASAFGTHVEEHEAIPRYRSSTA